LAARAHEEVAVGAVWSMDGLIAELIHQSGEFSPTGQSIRRLRWSRQISRRL